MDVDFKDIEYLTNQIFTLGSADQEMQDAWKRVLDNLFTMEWLLIMNKFIMEQIESKAEMACKRLEWSLKEKALEEQLQKYIEETLEKEREIAELQEKLQQVEEERQQKEMKEAGAKKRKSFWKRLTATLRRS